MRIDVILLLQGIVANTSKEHAPNQSPAVLSNHELQNSLKRNQLVFINYDPLPFDQPVIVTPSIPTKHHLITPQKKRTHFLPNAGKMNGMESSTTTPAAAAAAGNGKSTTAALFVRLISYYFLLYFFTVVYNVANKRVLNSIPLPATIAVVQLALGIPLFLPLWFAKPPRQLLLLPRKPLIHVAIAHALGSLATVYSLASGAISFTHMVKSAEPVFSAFLSAALMKSYFAPIVYSTLIPIVVGVAIASIKDLNFSWYGFVAAMFSNLFYQLRIVLSKQLLVDSSGNSRSGINRSIQDTQLKRNQQKSQLQQERYGRDTPSPSASAVDNMAVAAAGGKPLSASNLFRAVTIISVGVLLPVAFILEGDKAIPMWRRAVSGNTATTTAGSLTVNILVSGLSYYLYNEIAFWILDLVHPVTHAVGNTIKRVVLIVASVLIFRIPMNLQGAIGSFIAILGSFLYVLAHRKYQAKENE